MTIVRIGASSFVQSNATTHAMTFSPNPGAGVKVLCFVQCGGTVSSVVDNGTTPTTFTQDKHPTGGQGTYVYRGDAVTMPASGSYTVTVTTTATIAQAVAVAYTGVAAGAPGASNQSNATSTAVTSLAAGSAATGGALYFGGFTDASGIAETINYTGPASITSEALTSSGVTFWPMECRAGILPFGGSQTLTWTLGDSVAWSAALCVYSAVGRTLIPDLRRRARNALLRRSIVVPRLWTPLPPLIPADLASPVAVLL